MIILFLIQLLAVMAYSIIMAVILNAMKSAPPPGPPEKLPSVTVLVAARNVATTISPCLNSLAGQDYPPEKLQVLIIDDQSHDKTADVVSVFGALHPHIKLLKSKNPKKWQSSKKAALHTGAQHARGDILLLTDADCVPPPSWVRAVVRHFKDHTGLVAGFSPQRVKQPVAWNRFLTTDSLAAALVAFTSINSQQGITCTGRNLAIKKQALQDIGGYTALPDTLSGDDDFILQAISNHPKWQTTYAAIKASHVPAKGPRNWQQFLRQKTRHISAGKRFTFGQQAGYAFYHGANFIIWGAALTAVITMQPHWLLPLLFKLLIDYLVLSKFNKMLSGPLTPSGWWLWELLYPLYHILSAPKAFFTNPRWK